MNILAVHGIYEFIIALGDRAEATKQYLLNFFAINDDISIDLANTQLSSRPLDPFALSTSAPDTDGWPAETAPKLVPDNETFIAYGDGVAALSAKMRFHHSHGNLATVATVLAPEPFGALRATRATAFFGKPGNREGWINGGFFVLLQPKAIACIADDMTRWERSPVEPLAQDGELTGHRHQGGLWTCMDTLRQKGYLEQLWSSGRASWVHLEVAGRPHPSLSATSGALSHTFADLGMSPLAKRYLSAAQLNDMESFYPLRAWVCERCVLAQPGEFEPPASIFTAHPYFASYADTSLKHVRTSVDMLIGRFAFAETSRPRPKSQMAKASSVSTQLGASQSAS